MISRRQFLTGLAAASFGGGAVAFGAEDKTFPRLGAVRRLRRAGPRAWNGRRAVFLTDIHYGRDFGARDAAALNTAVIKERPDFVLMGGDLADCPHADLSGFFAHWAPGCPTLFAPGNHDLCRGPDQPVLRQAAAAGLTVLRNEAVTWRGLTIIGFPSALHERQRRSLLKLPGSKLLLAHEPDAWDWYGEADVLQLAGHTHGGQVRVLGRPILLPTLGKKYPLGQYARAGGRELLVSAGVGVTGPHVRIDCPPEICTVDFVG